MEERKEELKNKTKETKQEKTKKEKNKNDKKTNKFVEIIKKKWLINGTRTCLLVAIIIAIFIAINIIMQKL